MRRLLFITCCFVLAAAISCSRGGKADFAAAHAARDYYRLLIDEHFEKFVDGMDFPERIPDDYREQLVANARMFAHKQMSEHEGLRDVRVVNCINDSTLAAANAFLMLCFGDSTIEEVVVPMVKRGGRWYMK